MNLLLSALGRPKNLWTYSNPKPDLASLAASYAFGIARNHAFIDGNKRTAFVVCRTFLLLNDSDLPAIEIGRYASFLKLAAGDLSEADLAEWIRSGLRPR